MPNTYTQIHIHVIFAVKFLASVIKNNWKDQLYKYITGIIQNQNHKLIAINGVTDHIHILFGIRPVQALADLMQDIKSGSSKWINEKKFCNSRFEWQEGYGAFSYSKSQIKQVATYIENQEEHHRKQAFADEYKEFLDKFDVDYEERFLFKDLE